ncbi:MAG TPA: hypothetical protein VL096_14825 [Pirellulaceae bacterium]|nr:hypothetical protein [Pirellulaceae bacterium]
MILFLVDLLAPVSLAPFKRASWLMDVVFVLCAGGLGYMSWTTLKEQG